MEYKKILYEVRDGVAVITINSPKTLNAITDEIIEEHVGASMGIQIPLLVIDRRVVSVMSACLPNP